MVVIFRNGKWRPPAFKAPKENSLSPKRLIKKMRYLLGYVTDNDCTTFFRRSVDHKDWAIILRNVGQLLDAYVGR